MAVDPAVLEAFERQVGWCEGLGSPFTAALLDLTVQDLKAGGPSAEIVTAWEGGDPVDALVALRFAAGVTALVLKGDAPDLAAEFPAPGRALDRAALWQATEPVLHQHKEFLQDYLQFPVQTNETARAGSLLGGFLWAHKRRPKPLRMLEIGASAGLIMQWNDYHYDLGGGLAWGNEDSPLTIETDWRGKAPDIIRPLTVASRTGCDINPVDWSDDAQQARMRSYIWPDMFDRMRRFEAAAQMIKASGLKVDTADAADWLGQKLARPAEGQLTIVHHSYVWTYLPAATAQALRHILEAAGARATDEAPLAWVRTDPEYVGDAPQLKVTLWPGGKTEILGDCHPHGNWLRWN